eukprot:TRINITY_DN205_c2_g2_i1.p2 TRINITY_DN205_c2_g2~~TRINITY_DN205_c2_g2_i1.p2  ORF type:complete len:419 (-),score=62.37 TRINITY_DN205_c2_g2_i1:5098-6354(-)
MEEERSSPRSIHEEFEEVKGTSEELLNEDALAKLDADIQQAEHEILQMNQKYMRQAPAPLKLSTSSVTPSNRPKTPVFEASLYSPKYKSHIRTSFLKLSSLKECTKEDPWERYKKFEKSKRTHFHKDSTQVSRELSVDRPSGKIRQTDPLLFLDVTLTPEITVRVPVTKMDTPSFLAEKCFSLAGMKVPKAVLSKLSEIIRARINQEVQNLVAFAKETKARDLKEEMERKQRLKEIAKEKEKEFNLFTNKRPIQRENKGKIVGKLSVLIGKSRTADIIIREGDDPEVLVENFLAAFSLSRDHAQEFLEAIQNLIDNAKYPAPEEKAPERVTPPISRSKTPTSGKGEVLFRVQFNTEEGKKVSLDVKKNDNLYQVAHRFVTTHGLGMEKVNTVWECLKELYKVLCVGQIICIEPSRLSR